MACVSVAAHYFVTLTPIDRLLCSHKHHLDSWNRPLNCSRYNWFLLENILRRASLDLKFNCSDALGKKKKLFSFPRLTYQTAFSLSDSLLFGSQQLIFEKTNKQEPRMVPPSEHRGPHLEGNMPVCVHVRVYVRARVSLHNVRVCSCVSGSEAPLRCPAVCFTSGTQVPDSQSWRQIRSAAFDCRVERDRRRIGGLGVQEGAQKRREIERERLLARLADQRRPSS